MKKCAIAWAAGLFEGEGCFSTTGRPGVRGRRSARAMLGMKDRATVERFRDVLGFGRIYKQRRESHVLWMWQTTNNGDFERAVRLLSPWLSERRLQRIKELEALRAKPVGDAWETRRRRGRNGKKLTPEQVYEIRADSDPYPKVAERFGISITSVCNIKQRKRWAHLPG